MLRSGSSAMSRKLWFKMSAFWSKGCMGISIEGNKGASS
jgi:hypothetical protein